MSTKQKIDPGLRVMVREMVSTLKHAGLNHEDILSLIEEFRSDSNGALRRANEQLEQIKNRQARRSFSDSKSNTEARTDSKELKK